MFYSNRNKNVYSGYTDLWITLLKAQTLHDNIKKQTLDSSVIITISN